MDRQSKYFLIGTMILILAVPVITLLLMRIEWSGIEWSGSGISGEEYQVLAAVLEYQSPPEFRKPLFVSRDTCLPFIARIILNEEPSFGRKMLDNFEKNNDKVHHIRRFPSSVDYRISAPEDVSVTAKALGIDQPYWIQFSRPGFDPKKRKAFVVIYEQRGYLRSARSWLFVLKNVEGVWETEKAIEF
jgi:hypothetical protein